MGKATKIVFGILTTIVIIIMILAGISYYMLERTLPKYDGTVEVAGLNSSVKVFRDSLAIPYIKANDEQDAAFALGYVHAQDRLFQMDLMRRAIEGRLSEVLGDKTVKFDKMFRTFGFYRNRFDYYNNVPADIKRNLIAYSKGVNAFINDNKGRLPIEFTLLGYTPEQWKPEESVLVAKLLAYQLNYSWWTDIAFSRLVQKLGYKKVKELLPDFPENSPTIIPKKLKQLPLISDELVQTDREFRKFIGFTGTHIGSNNWVVNGKMSVTGKPIIANDPHLAHQLPGLWYLVVINSPTWETAGVTLTGIPGVVIGKNSNISWVLTNVMADDSDYYIEELDSSGTKYKLDGKWKELKVFHDTIKVKDKPNIILTEYYTHRGPVVSGIHSFLDSENNAPTISMRWTGLDKTNEVAALININKAKNWNDFKNGVKMFSVPGQNFVYADKLGNIGYICGVKLPIRNTNSPTFFFDGTTGRSDWKGFVPFEKLPQFYNPGQNFIATANNKVLKNYKYHISNVWEPSSRIDRITELLKSKKEHSVKDFQKYQIDQVSKYAADITPFIVKAFNASDSLTPNMATALGLLRYWDFNMSKESQTPAIYSVFFNKFMKNIFLDDLGKELYSQYIFIANVPYRKIKEIIKDNHNQFFDNVTTKQVETRDDVIRKSLVEAVSELEEKYGKNPTDWQWGKLHSLLFKHAFHGAGALTDKLFDAGPFPIGGSGTTIFNTEYMFTKPYANILGPSMRYIFDFSTPDLFYIVLPSGESGNFMSKHYKEMIPDWLKGNYYKVRTDFTRRSRRENKLLTLKPAA